MHNAEHAVPTDTGTLCVTNHLLFRDGAGRVPDDTDNERAKMPIDALLSSTMSERHPSTAHTL